MLKREEWGPHCRERCVVQIQFHDFFAKRNSLFLNGTSLRPPSAQALASGTEDHICVLGTSSSMPAPARYSHGAPAASRPPRFILSGRAGLDDSSMSQEAIRQTQAEFTAFLSALDTVESAGHGGLVALPRERLIEIQRILRAGGGVLQPLPPVPAPGSTSTTTFVPIASVPAPSQSGLTEAELAQIQTRVLQPRPTEELQACAVCLSDMQPGERCTALACGHQYHHDCVLRWLHLSRTCPLCKAHALGAGPPGEHQDKSASPSRNEAEAQLLTAAANAIMASRAASTQHRADLSELTLAAALGEQHQHQHQHQHQPSLAGSARAPQPPSAVASTISFGVRDGLLRPQPPSAVASTVLLGGRESLLRRIHISAARAGGTRAIGGALI
jgi:hypothetical protein